MTPCSKSVFTKLNIVKPDFCHPHSQGLFPIPNDPGNEGGTHIGHFRIEKRTGTEWVKLILFKKNEPITRKPT